MTDRAQKVEKVGSGVKPRTVLLQAAGAVLVLLPIVLPLLRALLPTAYPDAGSAPVARLYVGAAELFFMAVVFLNPAIPTPRQRDWPPLALFFVFAWFLWTGAGVIAAPVPAVALVRQAEWMIHGFFALSVAMFLSAAPRWRPAAGTVAIFGLALHMVLSAHPWRADHSAWGEAAMLILAHPLNGIGPDHFGFVMPGMAHPANGPLQLALEWGVPGALLFFIAIVILIRRALKDDGPSGRILGVGLVVVILLLSLVSGALYLPVPLMLLAVGCGLILDPARPRPGEKRFDSNIHGMVALCAVILLIDAFSLRVLTAEAVPPPQSRIAAFLTHFPAAMTLPSAGPHLDRWACRWRSTDSTAAYGLLDWTSHHSPTPWTSLALMGTWLGDDGYAIEGANARQEARQKRPPGWLPPPGLPDGACA
jgi:hypothetical protein